MEKFVGGKTAKTGLAISVSPHKNHKFLIGFGQFLSLESNFSSQLELSIKG